MLNGRHAVGILVAITVAAPVMGAFAEGSIRIDSDYKYTNTKHGSKVIPATAFSVFRDFGTQLQQPTYWYLPDESGQATTDLKLTAPIQLPDLVAITQIDFFIYDNDSTENLDTFSKAVFWEAPLVAGSPPDAPFQEVAAETTGASEDLQAITITLDPPVIVDNSANQYIAQVILKYTNPTNGIRFYGARAHFEYSQMNH